MLNDFDRLAARLRRQRRSAAASGEERPRALGKVTRCQGGEGQVGWASLTTIVSLRRVEEAAAPRDRGGSFGLRPAHDQVHHEEVPRRCGPSGDDASRRRGSGWRNPRTSMATATLTSRCAARPDVPCEPPRSESQLRAAARRFTSEAGIEPEKWALLLLEFCAAGWVLARSGRAHARRDAGFHLLSGGQGGSFAETTIGFRAF